MGEQRQFSRIDFHTTTSVVYKNQRFEAQLLDISLKGALLSIEEALLLSKEEECSLEINLGGSEVVLTIKALLVHIHENSFGFKFQSIDLESLSHLRRLMEINLGNTDRIDQELFFLSNP